MKLIIKKLEARIAELDKFLSALPGYEPLPMRPITAFSFSLLDMPVTASGGVVIRKILPAETPEGPPIVRTGAHPGHPGQRTPHVFAGEGDFCPGRRIPAIRPGKHQVFPYHAEQTAVCRRGTSCRAMGI
jgi:hypothetical protein